MKQIIIAVVALALLAGFMYTVNQGSVTTATNPQPQILATSTTQIIEKDALQMRVQDAQDAAKEQIEQDAEAVKQKAIEQANIEIELTVTTEYRKEVEAREKELQSQSITY